MDAVYERVEHLGLARQQSVEEINDSRRQPVRDERRLPFAISYLPSAIRHLPSATPSS
ncbi:MAG TPA: hypothetical protein VJ124_02025 [Pyrinomonadaceae bacterium]|nr:hypothetical protein [Pyrinomonadaceae bacterium]